MTAKCICVAMVCGAISKACAADAVVAFRNAPPEVRTTAPSRSTPAAVPVPPPATPSREAQKGVTIVTRAGPSATVPLSPGIYNAEPYTMIVVVPAPIDSKIAFDGGDGKGKPPEVIEPPLRLVPRVR
jgi:hypothetical protein